MSKKDYEKVAWIIRQERLAWTADTEYCQGATNGVANITSALADMFSADNPRFDRQRFFAACRGEDGKVDLETHLEQVNDLWDREYTEHHESAGELAEQERERR